MSLIKVGNKTHGYSFASVSLQLKEEENDVRGDKALIKKAIRNYNLGLTYVVTDAGVALPIRIIN